MNERFGIPAKRKIAVFAGSVAEWTMARKLVDSLPLWPDDWVLVMHDRYGGVSEWQRVARQHIPNRFYLSDDSFPSIEGLGHLLHGADLGIALYHPTYDSAWTGRNIANLGMSSGKIATYMQHGLPVLINELGEISDHVREKALGMVVRDVSEIPRILRDFDPESARSWRATKTIPSMSVASLRSSKRLRTWVGPMAATCGWTFGGAEMTPIGCEGSRRSWSACNPQSF